MKTSESLAEFGKALSAAQGMMRPAVLDAVGHYNKYATLNSVWEACRGPLSKNGLSIIQTPTTDEAGRLWLTTRIVHASGEWIESTMEILLPKRDIQGVGSAISYGRRYMIGAMVGITTDEDDDGQSSVGQEQPPRKAKKARPDQKSSPPDGNPSDWLPDLAEFKDRMTTDFKMTWDEVKLILKNDCGITGFKPAEATDAYNKMARVMAKTKPMPQAEAIPGGGQRPIFPDEPEPAHDYDE